MKKILLSCCLLLHCWLANALEISVGAGKIAAKPIAVVPFSDNGGSDKIDFIVSSDLKQSGVFAPISPSAYQARPADAQQIDYAAFQSLGAAYVVVGRLVNPQTIRFALADAFQQQIIGSYTVTVPPKTLRQAAHEVSDIILEKLTGVRGAFATRLVYVYETGSGNTRRYHIMLSDSDGADPKTLLTSRAPVMSPRFSPDGSRIAYVTFEGKHSQIVTQNIHTGKRALVSKAPGINSAPAWSPDGNKIAMVLSKDGNSEVYFKNLANGQLTRVTNNPKIDTEPAWSPSGNEIYFTSDRSGSPQLYHINIHNGALKKITNTGSYSAGAAISPDGKRIALARNNGGSYIIGTIDRGNGQFYGVSKGFVDETPRFSPNGKMLIFTSVEGGKSVLKIVNVDGSGTNTLSTGGQIRDPDWSPLIR
ncbi:MAG: Tol-Pal system beta propeller repeat protein TolB [Gammaproteobacteria bacterium]|nr:MAG: Tol-Pal system beta propeller repeat protein TolB [Gammaproteobacteria bacterium]